MTTNPITRTRVRPLAAALAITLGALGITTGGAAIAQAAPATVADGTLDWGVKQSFRNYIKSPVAHGSITLSGGATENADGTFRFPSATGSVDADANTADLAFAGKVQFTGHDSGSGPLLFLSIEDIRVKLTGTGGELVADVVSKSLSSGENTTYDDVHLASLGAVDLTGGDPVTGAGIAATLTEPGAPAFAGFYGAGTALDPLSFTVSPAPAPVWEPTLTPAKTTGIDPAGETITVSGNGFDPAANVGARPPLAGAKTGVYLVFAKITEPWRPSAGAPASARTVLDQKWVLPAASRAILDPSGTNPDYVVLGEDGTFTGTLDVAAVTEGKADCAVDTCGVITYAAGGAVNAGQELFVPLTFGTTATTTTAPTTTTTTTTTTAPTSTTTTKADGTVTGARLDWGLKESFRGYVRGPIAHGSWTLDGVTGEGPFRWENLTSGAFDPAKPEGRLDFAGSVHFTGHGGLLDLTVSQPQVRVSGGTAELLLDVRSKGLETPGYVELDDAVFATLDLASVTPSVADGLVTYAGVPATLTAKGAEGFAGFYQEGAALDPVTFTVAVDGAALPAAGPHGGTGPRTQAQTTKLASTGVAPWTLVGAGALLVLVGVGLLTLRRRRVAQR